MIISFYKTRYSENSIPDIIDGIHYDEGTGVLTFTGNYDVEPNLLPQKVIIIVEGKRYPLLIQITNILYNKSNTVVLLTTLEMVLTTEKLMKEHCA